MATQRLSVATIAGDAADVVFGLFDQWRSAPDVAAIDQFCISLRQSAPVLPVIFFTEWIDHWLMGDMIPGLKFIEGRKYHTQCFDRDMALMLIDSMGNQFDEQIWLSRHIQNANTVWSKLAEKRAVVLIREVLGASVTDGEISASLNDVPEWLK